MTEPAGPRHSPAEHLVSAEDILDAVPPYQRGVTNKEAWAAQAQASSLLAATHALIAMLLFEE
jgi:hypothetical protein